MRWLIVLASIVVSTVVSGGCGKKDSGPSCEVVVDHMLAVTKEAMAGHQNVKIDGQRNSMIANCEKKEMPADTRTCIMGAKTLAEISRCRHGTSATATDKPRPRLGSGSSHKIIPLGGSGSGSAGSGSTSTGSAAGSGSAK